MDNFTTISDEQLAAKSQQGSLDAYEELVRRHETKLFHFLCLKLSSREDAEDLAQKTFLTAWKRIELFRCDSKFTTWLYTIAGNLAKTELRRRKRWHWVPIGPSDDDERVSFFEPVARDLMPGDRSDTTTVHGSVIAAIHRLPEEFREAVLLRDLNGLSYEEISKIINRPVGTVKSRVNRGRIRLQKNLRPLAEEVIGNLSATA